MRRIIGSTFLLALAIVALPTQAHADTTDFTFDSFHADYTLSRLDDGAAHLDVVETIVARFPEFDQNRGIIRAIPDDYDGVALDTVVTSVVDENGAAVPYTTENTNGFIELALGTDEFVHGAVSYVISYSQDNVVRSFADTNSDEFYWDVNGTGWQQPFGEVSANVTVDASAAAALSGNVACYVGPQGSTTRCPIEQLAADGSSAPTDPAPADPLAPEATAVPTTPVRFSAAAQSLNPGEGLTVSIGFAPNTFLTPEPTKNLPAVVLPIPLENSLLSGGIGLLSLAGLAAAIVARVRSGRGDRGRGVIIPEYSEPKDLTILQAAHLVGRPATAIPAAIVRLAVRKNIRILAYAVEADGEPYTLQYLGSAGVNAEDAEIIRLIFGDAPANDQTRQWGPSEQDMMTSLRDLSGKARQSLLSAEFLRQPPGRAIGVLLGVGQIILGIVAVAVYGFSLASFNNVSGVLLISAAVGTIAMITTWILAGRPLQNTAKGALAQEYLEGIKLYLTVAEEDRLRALQSPTGAERIDVGNNLEMVKLYEKLLPWAVLWSVEEQWMQQLALRIESLPEQPDFFLGSNGFNTIMFASMVRGFSDAMAPPAPAYTSSGGGSFGGGSFGGGFSGGGGGGGGGGGR